MGLDPVSWAVIAATALTTATSIKSMTTSAPTPPKPAPPPPPPPPPPEEPPLPPDTSADTAPLEQKRKRARAFGVAQTVLSSPLGSGGSGPGPTGRGASLLGGG